MNLPLRVKDYFRSDLSVASFLYSVAFILFCRVDLFFSVWTTSDENGYLNRIDRFLSVFFTPLPSVYEGQHNFYAPGAPLSWLPGAFISRIVSPLLPGQELHWHWAFVSVYSSLFWILLFLLAVKVCEELSLIPRKQGGALRVSKDYLFVFIVVTNFQVMHYAFHRTLMSHTVEVTLALLTLYLALKEKFLWSLVACALLSMTRFNDVPVFLLVFGRYLDVKKIQLSPKSILKLMKENVVVTLLSLFALGWVFKIAFISGYAKFKLSDIMVGVTSWDIVYFFMAPDWGVFWLIPLWIVGFILGLVYFKKISFMAKAALVWMSLDMFICVLWRTNGSDFGQRYLMGATCGMLIVWAESLRHMTSIGITRFHRLNLLNATWITLLSLVFFTTVPTYSDNPLYMAEAIPTFFGLEYQLRAFELSALGVVWNSIIYGTGFVLPLLKRQVSTVHIEGLRVFFFLFGVCLFYCLLFVQVRMRMNQESVNHVS